MQMIYDSPSFCVVEFSDIGGEQQHPDGGYEIVDKALRREIFIGGAQANAFRDNVRALIDSEPSVDEVDDFLADYTGVMSQPLRLH
jgi:hypothetical protein